jgi:hypothetical protein
VCDSLKACYLVNLCDKTEQALTGNDSFTVDKNNTSGYSIRCDVNGQGDMNIMKYFYNGGEEEDYETPWWMDGQAGDWIVPVPYLASCGTKYVTVQGHVWSTQCFEQKFTIQAKCDTNCDKNKGYNKDKGNGYNKGYGYDKGGSNNYDKGGSNNYDKGGSNNYDKGGSNNYD